MASYSEIYKELKKNKNLTVRRNEPLSKYTTLRIGGPASLLVIPSNIQGILDMLSITSGVKKYIIGNGSNLLIPDSGIKGTVVRISGGINNFECDGRKIIVGSGMLLPTLIKKTIHLGLSGLEFAAGIPAAVGGATITNAGALGSEFGNLIDYIEIIDRSGTLTKISKRDLKFSYRKCSLKDCIVVSVRLKLKHKKPENIRKKIKDNLLWRRDCQPISVPSAGSVFKNPKDVPAGKLIDMAGLKGLRIGGAEISKKHGNFIINLGDAKESDVSSIIRKVRTVVKEKFRVNLELELIDSHQLTMLS